MQPKKEIRNLSRRALLKYISVYSTGAILPLSFAFPGFSNLRKRSPADLQIASPDVLEKTIPTATGEISPSQMGITSVHEHIILQSDPVQRKISKAFAIAELKKAKALGLKTIVDVGPTDDAAGIKEVALAAGVNIICCTGFYILKDDQQTLTVEDFENKMITDIETGLQGTGIRPGVIKVAARGLPIKPAEKNLFIAAAHVQKRYKLTICTHAVSGCAEQQQILDEAGADLAHCYFSHVEATFGWSGRTVEQEIEYLEAVVKKGSTLSFNNFGNWNHTKPADLARIIQELIKRGYDDRMVATMDVTWSIQNDEIKILWEDSNQDGKDRTYSYLLRKAVPWMKEKGIAKTSIDKFIISTPRRLFTW